MPLSPTRWRRRSTCWSSTPRPTPPDSTRSRPRARAGLVVIGSSGLTSDDFAEIDEVARASGTGVLAVGNFAITAGLLDRFAVAAAEHLPSWEILDVASDTKMDAPSGMARQLAWRLA